MDDGAEPEHRDRDLPSPPLALGNLVGEDEQAQPQQGGHDMPAHPEPERAHQVVERGEPRAQERHQSEQHDQPCDRGQDGQDLARPDVLMGGRRHDRLRKIGDDGMRRVGEVGGLRLLGRRCGHGGTHGGDAAATTAGRSRRARELGSQRGEQDDVADRFDAADQHHQAVDADAQPPRAGHAVFERAHVVQVDVTSLGIALFLGAGLGFEGFELQHRVVLLAVGVAQLVAAHDQLEALHVAGLGPVGARERRHFLRVVETEQGLAHHVLSLLVVNRLHETARAPIRLVRQAHAIKDRTRILDRHRGTHLDADLVLDQVGHAHTRPWR